jgi:hypothetical protein
LVEAFGKSVLDDRIINHRRAICLSRKLSHEFIPFARSILVSKYYYEQIRRARIQNLIEFHMQSKKIGFLLFGTPSQKIALKNCDDH